MSVTGITPPVRLASHPAVRQKHGAEPLTLTRVSLGRRQQQHDRSIRGELTLARLFHC